MSYDDDNIFNATIDPIWTKRRPRRHTPLAVKIGILELTLVYGLHFWSSWGGQVILLGGVPVESFLWR